MLGYEQADGGEADGEVGVYRHDTNTGRRTPPAPHTAAARAAETHRRPHTEGETG